MQGFNIPLSPEQERAAAAADKAQQAALQQQEMDRMRRTLEEQLRTELNDVLAANEASGWRQYLCCCMPKKQVRIRTTQELEMQNDGTSLLHTAPEL